MINVRKNVESVGQQKLSSSWELSDEKYLWLMSCYNVNISCWVTDIFSRCKIRYSQCFKFTKKCLISTFFEIIILFSFSYIEKHIPLYCACALLRVRFIACTLYCAYALLRARFLCSHAFFARTLYRAHALLNARFIARRLYWAHALLSVRLFYTKKSSLRSQRCKFSLWFSPNKNKYSQGIFSQ